MNIPSSVYGFFPALIARLPHWCSMMTYQRKPDVPASCNCAAQLVGGLMSFTHQTSQKGPSKSTGALFVFWQPSSTVLRQAQMSTTRTDQIEKIPGVDSR